MQMTKSVKYHIKLMQWHKNTCAHILLIKINDTNLHMQKMSEKELLFMALPALPCGICHGNVGQLMAAWQTEVLAWVLVGQIQIQ